MIDLSNNNSATVDFRKLRAAGQRRVYLKATEGLSFIDGTFKTRRAAARAAGLKVGAYHFCHPTNNPEAEAKFFHAIVGHLGPNDLRPCLDFEIGQPSAVWASRFLRECRLLFGVDCIIYSYADFIARLRLRKPFWPLWLAAFGRNDGKEYPFYIPAPYKKVAAHQFSSRAHVLGVRGEVDISHILNYGAIDVPRFSLARMSAARVSTV